MKTRVVDTRWLRAVLLPPAACVLLFAGALVAGYVRGADPWLGGVLIQCVPVAAGLGWSATFCQLIGWGVKDDRARRIVWFMVGLFGSPMLTALLMLLVLLLFFLITGFPSV